MVNIVTQGGVVLWSYSFFEIDDNTVRTIVKNVLIEEKYEEYCQSFNKFQVKWKMINDLDCIIIIIYQGIININYAENILKRIKSSFLDMFPKSIDVFEINIPIDFDKQFLEILDESDNLMKNPKNFTNNTQNNNEKKKNKKNGKSKKKTEQEQGMKLEQYMQQEQDNQDHIQENKNNENNKKNKAKKVAREWEMNQKITKKVLDKLDYSKNEINNNDEKNDEPNKGNNELNKYEGEIEESSEEEAVHQNVFLSKLNETFFKMFRFSNKIEESDIENILLEIKNKFLSKNVAVDICETLLERMKEKLIGQKKTLFARNVKSVVSTVLTETLQTILIPKDSVDILRSALEAKSSGRLYSIVFLGVNGVGKSTNLAKVCYYLKQKGNLKIMIAACDTFRAGAVEQLRTHARCLDVFLFERGYGKDASNIAKDAITYAKRENYDVILIDTAGRMQDNEPLMRSLGKLIVTNNPDLILFVGEALVGNDAIDQLKKFNQALNDATCNTIKRSIDGIILTKFDTVDDKVGAALSMIYLTGKPIVFVGVGQKYTHLKKFNVNLVVKALS